MRMVTNTLHSEQISKVISDVRPLRFRLKVNDVLVIDARSCRRAFRGESLVYAAGNVESLDIDTVGTDAERSHGRFSIELLKDERLRLISPK